MHIKCEDSSLDIPWHIKVKIPKPIYVSLNVTPNTYDLGYIIKDKNTGVIVNVDFVMPMVDTDNIYISVLKLYEKRIYKCYNPVN